MGVFLLSGEKLNYLSKTIVKIKSIVGKGNKNSIIY